MNRVEWGEHNWWIKGETYTTSPGQGEIQSFVVIDSSVHVVVRTDHGHYFDVPVRFVKEVNTYEPPNPAKYDQAYPQKKSVKEALMGAGLELLDDTASSKGERTSPRKVHQGQA